MDARRGRRARAVYHGARLQQPRARTGHRPAEQEELDDRERLEPYADGQRFIFIEEAEQGNDEDVRQIVAVLNWSRS